MCVDCLREFRDEIDRMMLKGEDDPLLGPGREVLNHMCADHDVYRNVMHMLAIYFAQFVSAGEQFVADVERMESSMDRARREPLRRVSH